MKENTSYSAIEVMGGWSAAMSNVRFRNKTIAGTTLLLAILLYFPYFFAFIERRQNGIILNDWLLQVLSPIDLSIPIFIIIWSTFALFIYRCFSNPTLFMQVVYTVIILSIARMTSIYLVHLEAPSQLIKLKDPLTSITYGGKDIFMTKDLFFSGHTSNMFLLALCFQKKSDKVFAFAATFLIAILVLFQHVHYSIDVIGAVVITYLLAPLGKKLSNI